MGRNREQEAIRILDRKQQVLETAFRLFAERGIDVVTMPEIAEASGVPRATLYRYVSDKMELVVEIGAWKWREYIMSRDAMTSANELEKMSGADRLRWYMDAFIDLYRNHKDLLRFNYFYNGFVMNGRSTAEQQSPYLKVIEGLKASFHGIYEKCLEEGTIRKDLSEEIMVSSSFHIMLAAVTRYAVGLVYVPQTGADPEAELVMLEKALLREYMIGE